MEINNYHQDIFQVEQQIDNFQNNHFKIIELNNIGIQQNDQLQQDKQSQNQEKNRSFFVDWIRSMGIYLVVIIHIFVSLLRTVQVTYEEYEKIQSLYRQIFQFGIPIYFYLSGRSSAFSKDSHVLWIWKKVMRLLLPIIFGTIIFVIPTAYIGREYRCQVNQDPNINFGDFIKRYFQDEFIINGFEWLWFLPILFGIAVLNYPFMKIIKQLYLRQKGGIQNEDIQYIIWMLAYIGIVIGITQVLKFNIILTVVGLIPLLLYLLIFNFLNYLKNNGKMEIFNLPCIICSLLLALIQPYLGGLEELPRKICMTLYFNMNYEMGFVDQLIYSEYQIYKQRNQHLKLRPISLFFLIFLIGLCQPTTISNVGDIWVYPMYNSPFSKFLYVAGTWMWIVLILRYGQAFLNEELDKFQYKLFTESSIITYLTHWLWIEIPNKYLVYDYKLNLPEAIVILLFSTITGCLLVYYILKKIPILGYLFGIEPQKIKKIIQNENKPNINLKKYLNKGDTKNNKL